jgi:hypothetical protein
LEEYQQGEGDGHAAKEEDIVPVHASLIANPSLSKDDANAPIPILPTAYSCVGIASGVAWIAWVIKVLNMIMMTVTTASSEAEVTSTCTTLTPKLIAIGQALAFPLPLLTTTILALVYAARHGWNSMEQPTPRRMNLALFTVSVWLAVAARTCTGTTTTTTLSTGWSKRLSLLYMVTAGTCWGVWKATVQPTQAGAFWETPLLPILRGVATSFKRLTPQQWRLQWRTRNYESTNKGAGTKERGGIQALYATSTVGFALLTLVSCLWKDPGMSQLLRSTPTSLGRPMAAFYALAATTAFCVKQALEENNGDRDDNSESDHHLNNAVESDNIVVTLQRGMFLSSLLHILGVMVPMIVVVPATITTFSTAIIMSLSPHLTILSIGWPRQKLDNIDVVDAEIV